MQVRIEIMSENDIEAVAEIENKSFSMPWSKEGFRSSLLRDDSEFLIAKINDKVVGYCGYYFAADEAEITNIAVDSEYRNKGIAYQIMYSVFEKCISRNTRSMYLEVRKSNIYAIMLYKKSGFIESGIRKNFYSKPKEDALVMIKQFSH